MKVTELKLCQLLRRLVIQVVVAPADFVILHHFHDALRHVVHIVAVFKGPLVFFYYLRIVETAFLNHLYLSNQSVFLDNLDVVFLLLFLYFLDKSFNFAC